MSWVSVYYMDYIVIHYIWNISIYYISYNENVTENHIINHPKIQNETSTFKTGKCQ